MLENKFLYGFHEGDKVLYVSIVDNTGKVEEVTFMTYASWDENWQVINESFEQFLFTNNDTSILKEDL